jgi:RNA polymerase sigma factor (sigma-70 family)
MSPPIAELVPLIAAGDPVATEQLYSSYVNTRLRSEIRFLLGPLNRYADVDDHVHDCFLALVKSIRHGRLRNPAALPGYGAAIVRHRRRNFLQRKYKRKILHESSLYQARSAEPTPEEIFRAVEQDRLLQSALENLKPRDRALITRFYFDHEPRESISESLGLSKTQFRLGKSRALGRMRLFVSKALRRKAR